MAFLWLVNGGDPNYLLTGMILQVEPIKNHWKMKFKDLSKVEGSKKVISFWKSSNLTIKRPTKMFLVGGFNPSEKY